jgi:hypothetical protein
MSLPSTLSMWWPQGGSVKIPCGPIKIRQPRGGHPDKTELMLLPLTYVLALRQELETNQEHVHGRNDSLFQCT